MKKSLLLSTCFASILACGGSTSGSNEDSTVKVASPSTAETGLAQALQGLRSIQPIALPTAYRATLKLDPSDPNFTGTIEIDVNLRAAKEFYLNSHKLEIQSAILKTDGRELPLQAEVKDSEWVLFHSDTAFAAGTGTLHIQYKGVVDSTSSFGLFRQSSAEQPYLFTQFEARGCRRAFPSLDQPDIKTPWTIALDVPDNLVALTNTPEVSRKSSGAGRTLVQFAKSQPLPTYLVAMAVGPFDVVNIGKSRHGVQVRVAVPKGRKAETGWVVESTLPMLALLEDYTGIPYPYAKLDLVSIPSTGSFSAMENAGLITYTESLLLSKDNSLAYKMRYASVGAHELAHQWFGNLVTNAWWDDIWLNESFATWAAAKTFSSFRSKWTSGLQTMSSRQRAMSADALASARVIREPIAVEGDIGDAFDGITYQKGAAILRMFEMWVGEKTFQKGIQRYLTKHAWKSVTASDFLRAMEEGTGTKMAAPFATFLNTPGTPLVHFSMECGPSHTPRVKVDRSRYRPLGSSASSDEDYQLPVCVRYPGKTGIVRDCTLLVEPTTTMELSAGEGCPAWLVPNAGGHGYYRSNLSMSLWNEVAKAPLTPGEQLVLASDVQALVQAGLIPVKNLLSVVQTLAKSDNTEVVTQAVMLADLESYLSGNKKQRRMYTKWLSKHFGKRAKQLGWKPKKGETASRKKLRQELLALVVLSGGDETLGKQGVTLAKRWLNAPSSVHPDIAELALRVGAQSGDAKLFAAYLKRIQSGKDKRHSKMLLNAMVDVKNATLIQQAMKIFLDPNIESRESVRGMGDLMQRPAARKIALDYVEANFPELVKKYGEEMQLRLAQVAAGQCDASIEARVRGFLKNNIEPLQGGKKAAARALERYTLCVKAKAKLRLPARF